MILNRTGAVQAPFSFKVSGMGFFWSLVKTNVFSHPVYLNISLPSIFRTTPYAKKTRAIGLARFPLILRVFSASNITKVADSVVVSDAVGMVNKVVGPNAVVMKPCQPMHQVRARVYSCEQIPLAVSGAYYVAGQHPVVSSSSREYPGIRVIVEKFAHSFRAKFASWLPYWLRLICKIEKVSKSVVAVVAVSVPYSSCRPLAMNVKPSEAMGVIRNPINSNVDVACMTSSPSDGPSRFAAAIYKPSEKSSFWVVIENFAQAFCAKIGISHDTVPSLIGQRPSSISVLAGFRHFNTWGK